jgi:hypothetical protein
VGVFAGGRTSGGGAGCAYWSNGRGQMLVGSSSMCSAAAGPAAICQAEFMAPSIAGRDAKPVIAPRRIAAVAHGDHLID